MTTNEKSDRKDSLVHHSRLLVYGLVTIVFLLFTGNGTAQPAGIGTRLTPQPDDQSLSPGLAAYYYKKKIRNLGRFPTGRWRKGKPIPMLNHHFGNGPVFDSGLNTTICVKMEGVIRLDSKGTYHFKALSNDGIRITIGGSIVAEDPNVHSDRLTKPVSLEIETKGWYPITVEYFQRKGTAAIEFHWQSPGSDFFSIVPAEAYAHIPEG